jgi:hypothetical protein
MLGSIRVCASGSRVLFGIPLIKAHALVDAEVEATTPDGETKRQLSLTAIVERILALDLKMWEGASGWFAKLEAGQALVLPPGHLVGEFGVASGKSSVVVKEAFLTENHCRDNHRLVEQMTLLANICTDDSFKVWKLMTLNQSIPLVQAITAAHHTSAMAAKLSMVPFQDTLPSSKSTLAEDALTESRKIATPLSTSPDVKTEASVTPCSAQNGVASARFSPASAKDAHLRIALAPTPKRAKLLCDANAEEANAKAVDAPGSVAPTPHAGFEDETIPAAPPADAMAVEAGVAPAPTSPAGAVDGTRAWRATEANAKAVEEPGSVAPTPHAGVVDGAVAAVEAGVPIAAAAATEANAMAVEAPGSVAPTPHAGIVDGAIPAAMAVEAAEAAGAATPTTTPTTTTATTTTTPTTTTATTTTTTTLPTTSTTTPTTAKSADVQNALSEALGLSGGRGRGRGRADAKVRGRGRGGRGRA